MKTFCNRTNLPGRPSTADYLALRQQVDDDLPHCSTCGRVGIPYAVLTPTGDVRLLCYFCRENL